MTDIQRLVLPSLDVGSEMDRSAFDESPQETGERYLEGAPARFH